jgi:hypothetical protein
MRGLFGQDWNPERLRLPKQAPKKADLQSQFETVRKLTLNAFSTLTLEQLNAVVQFGARLEWSLRSWLCCAAVFCIRSSWRSAPDIEIRARLGGV